MFELYITISKLTQFGEKQKADYVNIYANKLGTRIKSVGNK